MVEKELMKDESDDDADHGENAADASTRPSAASNFWCNLMTSTLSLRLIIYRLIYMYVDNHFTFQISRPWHHFSTMTTSCSSRRSDRQLSAKDKETADVLASLKDNRSIKTQIRDNLIAAAAKSYEEVCASNGGRLPQSGWNEILQSFANVDPPITRHTISGYLRRRKEKLEKARGSTPPSAVSSEEASADTASNEKRNDSTTDNAQPQPKKTRKRGHPKGSTDEAKRAREQCEVLACTAVTVRYKNVQDKLRPGQRLPKGTFPLIVEEVCAELNIPDFAKSISYKMVQARISRRNLDPINPGMGGIAPPLHRIEPILVDFVKAKERLGDNIKPKDFLTFVLSLIKGTSLEKDLLEFQRTICGSADAMEPTLTHSFYRGFMNRYSHLLVSKVPKPFNKDHRDWANYKNFEILYDLMERALVEEGMRECS